MTRKAVMRVASVLELSDHMSTTVLMTFLRIFLKESRYGSKGVMADRVNLSVDVSDKDVRRCWTEDVCDFRRGVRVLNFFESVATLTFPLVVSLTGK